MASMTRAVKSVGIRAGEPNPANAVDGADRPQQIGEIVLAVVIAVDRLARAA